MIRFRGWYRGAVWPASYWRERIKELRDEPAIAPAQQAKLEPLLNKLERIAAKLNSSPKCDETSQLDGRTMRDARAQAHAALRQYERPWRRSPGIARRISSFQFRLCDVGSVCVPLWERDFFYLFSPIRCVHPSAASSLLRPYACIESHVRSMG